MAGKKKDDHHLKGVKSLRDWDEVREENEDFSRRFRIFLDNEERWLKEYPNKWIGITEGDEVIVADDIHDLLARAEETGTRAKNMVAEYLDPLPRIL